jgi:hypothetical protein
MVVGGTYAVGVAVACAGGEVAVACAEDEVAVAPPGADVAVAPQALRTMTITTNARLVQVLI